MKLKVLLVVAGICGVDEATVHRIAWGAVKRHYRKLGDAWIPKE